MRVSVVLALASCVLGLPQGAKRSKVCSPMDINDGFTGFRGELVVSLVEPLHYVLHECKDGYVKSTSTVGPDPVTRDSLVPWGESLHWMDADGDNVESAYKIARRKIYASRPLDFFPVGEFVGGIFTNLNGDGDDDDSKDDTYLPLAQLFHDPLPLWMYVGSDSTVRTHYPIHTGLFRTDNSSTSSQVFDVSEYWSDDVSGNWFDHVSANENYHYKEDERSFLQKAFDKVYETVYSVFLSWAYTNIDKAEEKLALLEEQKEGAVEVSVANVQPQEPNLGQKRKKLMKSKAKEHIKTMTNILKNTVSKGKLSKLTTKEVELSALTYSRLVSKGDYERLYQSVQDIYSKMTIQDEIIKYPKVGGNSTRKAALGFFKLEN